MIGHYLLTLTKEQEDRVLTRRFKPLFDGVPLALDEEFAGCLMCAVTDTNWGPGCVLEPDDIGGARDNAREPGYVYEALCERFGAPRVNAAIRNRILANRVRRALAPASRENAVRIES